MHWYHAALGGMALTALLLSWNVPRCGKWIFLLSASYVASVLYHRLAPYNDVLPYGAVVAFFCDAILFLLIRQLHVEKWEYWTLGMIALGMALFNLVQIIGFTFGFPPVLSNTDYSSILEVANAAYLAIIGGVGLSDLVGRYEGHFLGNRSNGGVRSALSSAVSAARKKSSVRKLTL